MEDVLSHAEITVKEKLKSIWLGSRFVKITFSDQDDDPVIDVEEIRELFDQEQGRQRKVSSL